MFEYIKLYLSVFLELIMEYHSVTKINEANYCRRRYFLKNVLGDKPLNPSFYLRGRLVHDLIENFWTKLGQACEIKRNKKGKVTSEKKYSNAEEFNEYAKGQWFFYVTREERAKRSIDWRFENERWTIYNGYLPEICIPLFNKLVEEDPPPESELNFKFSIGNRSFRGRIDEVRVKDEQVIIRDYKTESPWIGGMKLTGNPQLTVYCVGLCALCYADEEFALRLGLEDERQRFIGHPIYISDRIKPEFFMVETLRKNPEEVHSMPELIYRTERTDRDFFEVLLFLEDIEEYKRRFLTGEKKTIPPTERGKKCDVCDMEKACMKRLEEELNATEHEYLKDGQGQLYFKSFVSPYLPKRKKKKILRQRKFRWKKS